MAIETDEQAKSGRGVLLIALLALVVTGTVAFGRVFDENDATLRLVLASVASLGLAALLERRHVLIAAAASAAGLTLLLTWMLYPGTAWYGLPTLTTWHTADGSIQAIGQTAEIYVAPAPTLVPLLLASLTAVWCAAFATHAMAARARSPFLSLIPPSALMAFAGVVMVDGARPVYVLPFLAACLAVVFADGLYRVGQWGPVAAWDSGRFRIPWGNAVWSRGARRVTLACLAVALFTPWVLPGFGGASVVDLTSGGGGASVTIDPIVDIRPKLLQQTGQELFTVRSARAAYWRFIALDEFSGSRWTSSDLYAQNGQELTGGDLLLQDIDTSARSRQFRYRVTIKSAVQHWLPMAYPASEVSTDGTTLRYDPATGTLVLPDRTYEGFTYAATSWVVAPTPEVLETVENRIGFPRRLVELPPDTPERVYQIARERAGDTGSPYERLLNIQDWLRSGSFTYDIDAPAGHGVNDIVFFLDQSRRGYCEQFAAAMAILARAIGIPARVAVGFTPGQRDEDVSNLWHVTGKHAHAWVEVLFPGWGWLAFEPTPTRTNPVANVYTQPANQNGNLPEIPGGGSNVAGPLGGREERQFLELERGGLRGRSIPPLASGTVVADSTSLASVAVRVLPVAGAVVLLAIPLVKLALRRRVLRRARRPRDRVLAAYRVMADRAGDVGLGPRPHETLREYRSRLESSVSFSNGPLRTVTDLAGLAAYSTDPVTPEQAEMVVASARQVTTDVRRSTGPARVALGWFRVDRSRTRP